MYCTANVSGGHLNPAVTFATCLTGHTSWGKGLLYAIAQVLGGVFGALFEVGVLLRLLLRTLMGKIQRDCSVQCFLDL